MSDNEDYQVRDLSCNISSLQSKFQRLRSLLNGHHVKRYQELDTRMKDAYLATLSLARLLNGEFNPSNPPSDLASTLQKMEFDWAQTRDAAQQGYEELSSYTAEIVQFNDSELGHWESRLTELQNRLKAKVSSIQAALPISKATLQQLMEQRETMHEEAKALETKLYEQQHRYDVADKLTWLWPPARLALEGIKLLIETMTHNLEGARQALNTAITELRQEQNRVKTQEDEVKHLNSLATDQATLISKGDALMKECRHLQKEVEQTEKVVVQHKKETAQAWHEISLCYNRAKTANFGLTKADYATAILKIVDVSTDDPMDQSILTGIVDELANHDDSNGSVGKIKTEEHPNGLLDYVQKKLQQGIGQDTMMAGSSGKNPVRELPVEARLKLIRSMVGALVKPRGQPGSMDISDVERVDLLSELSGLFVLGGVKA